MDMYNSLLYSKCEATKMSLGKQSVVHGDNHYSSVLKGSDSQTMQKHKGLLGADYFVKEGKSDKATFYRISQFDILENAQLWRQYKDQGLGERRVKR
jgi:antibiotic biosynthesis monooxygenase (ABM) superfamily enzyme